MVEELVFGCVSFSYDEDTFKVKCIGNVMLKLYKLDMTQKVCKKESSFTIVFFC